MNQPKRTSKTVIVVIVVIATILLLLPVIVAILGAILIPKMMGRIEDKVGNPNYEIEGLRVYIPRNWHYIEEYHVSPSGNCKIIGGTVTYDQDRMERILIEDELEHKQVTINDIDISYGFKNNGKEKIYSYFFEDNGHKYFILFKNNVDSDEECDSYTEKLEQSITLNTKGEKL